LTEAEWLAASGSYEWPHRLFNCLFFTGASDRKLRLSCVACCRIVEPFSGGSPFPFLIRLIEGFADGNEPEDKVNRTVESIGSWLHQHYQSLLGNENDPTPTEQVERLARQAILHAGSVYCDREWHESRKKNPYPCYVADDILNATALLGRRDSTDRSIIRIVHDIFGNPFRHVAVEPEWLTSTVVALAEGVYADRAFGRMPVLADALEDAGCSHEDILSHCRGGGPHTRGCWVVDLLTGRK
jgi:hypothetical protein